MSRGPTTAPRAERGLVIGLVAIGAILRLWVWAGNRSLWIDEATVAIGLLWKPFAASWGAHDFGQMTPPLWLGLVRASAAAFGPTEQALRLPTLILAIGYLPAIWALARALAGWRAALLALSLSAFSPALINYAVELKPYGTDPVVTVAVLALCLGLLRRPRLGWPEAILAGLALGGLCWLSLPAVIVVAGALPVALGWPLWARKAVGADLGPRIATGALAAGLFAVVYRGHLRLERWLVDYLAVFWEGQFFDPSAPDLAHRIWKGLMEMVSPPFFARGGDLFPALLLVAIGFGARRLWHSLPRGDMIVLLAPLPVLLILAVARQYPIASRLTLFALPIVTLMLVAGIGAWLATNRRPWIPRIVALLLVLLPVRPAFKLGRDPIGNRAHARPVLEQMASMRRLDDLTYIFARGAPEWFFYTTDWRDPDRARIAMVESEYRFPFGRTFSGGMPRPGRVLPIEDLRYHYRGTEEVYGQYSGYLWKTIGIENPILDSGWVAVERDRILRDRPPCVWLVVLHGFRVERTALRAALDAVGYHWWTELTAGGSVVYRGCRVAQ